MAWSISTFENFTFERSLKGMNIDRTFCIIRFRLRKAYHRVALEKRFQKMYTSLHLTSLNTKLHKVFKGYTPKNGTFKGITKVKPTCKTLMQLCTLYKVYIFWKPISRATRWYAFQSLNRPMRKVLSTFIPLSDLCNLKFSKFDFEQVIPTVRLAVTCPFRLYIVCGV